MDWYYQTIWLWALIIGIPLILIVIVVTIWVIMGINKKKIIQDREQQVVKTYNRSEGRTDYVLHGQLECRVTCIGHDLQTGYDVGEISIPEKRRPIIIRYLKTPIQQQPPDNKT